MKTRFDREQILKKVAFDESKKIQVTFRISEQVYKEFETLCGDVPTTKVVEELMWKFVHPKVKPNQRKTISNKK